MLPTPHSLVDYEAVRGRPMTLPGHVTSPLLPPRAIWRTRNRLLGPLRDIPVWLRERGKFLCSIRSLVFFGGTTTLTEGGRIFNDSSFFSLPQTLGFQKREAFFVCSKSRIRVSIFVGEEDRAILALAIRCTEETLFGNWSVWPPNAQLSRGLKKCKH